MNPGRIWNSLMLLAALGFVGCDETGVTAPPQPAAVSGFDWGEPRQAQPKLPTVKLWMGSMEMTAEVATTANQIRTGMMFRKEMGEDDGMLFVLPYTQRASFWMKNCFVPLSVAYIDPDGVIQEIHDLQPHNTNSVVATSTNIRFALETPQGWFKRRGIRAGTVIRTDRGSLAETFNAH